MTAVALPTVVAPDDVLPAPPFAPPLFDQWLADQPDHAALVLALLQPHYRWLQAQAQARLQWCRDDDLAAVARILAAWDQRITTVFRVREQLLFAATAAPAPETACVYVPALLDYACTAYWPRARRAVAVLTPTQRLVQAHALSDWFARTQPVRHSPASLLQCWATGDHYPWFYLDDDPDNPARDDEDDDAGVAV